MDGLTPVNLLIMANTIKNVGKSNKIVKVYDLKGSEINRLVVKGENQTKKDMNLIACKNNRTRSSRHGLIQFNSQDIKKIKKIINKDVKLM